MRYISYAVETGQKNMDIDAQLLEDAITKNLQEPIFRLYGWAPACVSLGRNQDDKFLDYDFLKSKNIDVVRRLTGGRALLHDNEITYSFICPVSFLKNGEHIVSSYIEISQILIEKFKKLGINLDFGKGKQVKTGFDYCMLVSTGADLCFENKKQHRNLCAVRFVFNLLLLNVRCRTIGFRNGIRRAGNILSTGIFHFRRMRPAVEYRPNIFRGPIR